jgi:membrane protein involved in colicin uptake
MAKFVKSIFGNVAAAGRYFMEGKVEQAEDDVLTHEEFTSMVSRGSLKVFDTEEQATAYFFRGVVERALAGESTFAPAVEETAEVVVESKADVKAKAEAEAKAKAKAEADAKAEEEAKAKTEADAKAKADAGNGEI